MNRAEFAKLVHEKFDSQCVEKIDFSDLRGLIDFSEIYGVMDEVAEYIHSKPAVTLNETVQFEFSLTNDGQPLEIVDDDELDDEDEED